MAVWADGTLVDHTFGKPHCWWFRYDHSLVMEGLTLGMKGMREGGQRQIRTIETPAYRGAILDRFGTPLAIWSRGAWT